jgi:hypothetical protein
MEKIRRRLFRQYTPEDYFIVPNSEQILPPSAESCWNAASGNYRVFALAAYPTRRTAAQRMGSADSASRTSMRIASPFG